MFKAVLLVCALALLVQTISGQYLGALGVGPFVAGEYGCGCGGPLGYGVDGIGFASPLGGPWGGYSGYGYGAFY